ncbi:hypothetical protein Misp01_00030 [Microtetraspora sp. NBRC 13810]|nr:hypothetical protein Misp01_00030 [Microtetraspora sp. NBRC 13810]
MKKVVKQPVDGHHRTACDKQPGQDRTLPPPAEVERAAHAPHLDRAKDAELPHTWDFTRYSGSSQAPRRSAANNPARGEIRGN